MANLKTSQFPNAGTLDGTELFGVVKGGNNVKTTLANAVLTNPTLAALASSGSIPNLNVTGTGTSVAVTHNAMIGGNLTAGGGALNTHLFSGYYIGGATPLFCLSANVFGAAASSSLGATYEFNVNADSMDATNANGGGSYGSFFGHTLSAGAIGGRNAIGILLDQAGITAPGDNQFYVALSAIAQGGFSAGGTSGFGNSKGNLFGFNPQTYLATGSGLYWNEIVGQEIDVGVQSSVGVTRKVGLKIVQGNGDAVHGSIADYAIGLVNSAAGGTPPGWNVGFTFGAPEGWWPITSTGTMIGTYAATIGGGPSMAAAYGIDFSAVTFGTAFLKSTGFLVNPSGGTSVSALTVTTSATPATAAATGTTGEVVWDASFVYVCIATNTWKKAAISTW